MKIATHDNKNPNYSCVAYMDGNEFRFLDKTYNKAYDEGRYRIICALGYSAVVFIAAVLLRL